MRYGDLLGAAGNTSLVPPTVGTGDVLQALGVFLGSIALAVLLRRSLARLLDSGAMLPGEHPAEHYAGRLLGRALSLLVVGLGTVYALSAVGIRIGPLVGALGVGGVAIAFAAQDILQNLIAGILLQVRRPFRLGDQVKLGEFEGRVDDVNLRTVIITTYDGLTVYLPNAQVLKDAIVNYTRTPSSRTELPIGVAYDSDLEQARQVLLAACRSTEGVLERPPPEAWVHEFAASSITIALRYWHAADIASRWRVRSAVAVQVKRALDDAGITIAFPQLTLWYGDRSPGDRQPGHRGLGDHAAG